MIRNTYFYRVSYVMGEWCVYIRDPKGRPFGTYRGFDGQVEAEEFGAKMVDFLTNKSEGVSR